MSKPYANEKGVVLFSGGLDSTTLLYKMIAEGMDVYALSILYGQKHKKEIEASQRIAQITSVKHKVMDISSLSSLFQNSALTNIDIPVPHGHYTHDSMKQTIVPNRNMLLISLATSWAITLKGKYVAYAAHFGDHTIYPDCTAEFAEALGNTLALCDWAPPKLLTPFIKISKTEIVKTGIDLKVPFEETWSCYEGKELHCGLCGTCVARKEAFETAGVIDPTQYENIHS